MPPHSIPINKVHSYLLEDLICQFIEEEDNADDDGAQMSEVYVLIPLT